MKRRNNIQFRRIREKIRVDNFFAHRKCFAVESYIKMEANQNAIINDSTVKNKRAGTQSHLGKNQRMMALVLRKMKYFIPRPSK